MSTDTAPPPPPPTSSEPQFPTPSASERDDWVRALMACTNTVCFTALASWALYLLFFDSSKLTNEVFIAVVGLVSSILGYWAGYQGTITNYLFGSSSGSKAKQASSEKQ